MVELIQQLLFTHNCVIIPNFGAFIGNYAPAKIHLQEKKILPPFKSIAFNRSLQKNDGILINAVAQQFNIPYLDAETKVTSFAVECNNSLAQHGSLIFKHIGRFVSDTEKNIRFQPYQSVNYLPQSFGLTPLSIEPVHRLKDEAKLIQENTEKSSKSEYFSINNNSNNNKSRKSWTYGIAAILVAALITTSIFWNLQNNNENRSKASILPTFDSTQKQETPPPAINSIMDAESIISETNPTQNLELTEPSSPVIVQSSPVYNIVIGAFFDEGRANLLKAEAESKNFKVSITKDSMYGIYRTTVLADSTDVSVLLQKVKQDLNTRAWVHYAN